MTTDKSWTAPDQEDDLRVLADESFSQSLDEAYAIGYNIGYAAGYKQATDESYPELNDA